jgi:hypothetical protein
MRTPSLGNHDSEGLNSYSFFLSLLFAVDLAVRPGYGSDVARRHQGKKACWSLLRPGNQHIRTLDLTDTKSKHVDFNILSNMNLKGRRFALQNCLRLWLLKPRTHYPHVTWAHVMLRVQLGYLTLNSGADSHFCQLCLRHVIWRGALVGSRACTPLKFLLPHTFRETWRTWAHVTWG